MVMSARLFPLMLVAVGLLAGCKDPSASDAQADPNHPRETPPLVETRENMDPNRPAPEAVPTTASPLRVMDDPIELAFRAAKLKTRQAYNNRQFDDLEAEAQRLRAGKERSASGSWKIVQFYDALDCADNEPESMWQLHDRIHREWIAAKPTSITARVAYASFLSSYAWQARGGGYADTVTERGWQLFRERLAASRKVLLEARSLDEKDPYWWMEALTVALGQGWDAEQYKVLVDEAHAFEPQFWGYDTSRAYSLLPRWHGEPGDWEAFAEETAARPDGLGIELYARIVMRLRGFYENVFRETKASWPKTREGLQALLKKHPESIGILSEAALLATMAEDRAMARELFDRLDGRCVRSTWKKPERFEHFRHWAETGSW